MSSTAIVRSRSVDLPHSLGTEGEESYQALLRVLRAACGRFALIPIESDFRPALRAAFLERLHTDLAQSNLNLKVLPLSREDWDLTACLDINNADVLAVVGLEDTPGIVPEPGAPRQRPPALAVLNHSRESLRRRIGMPLIVWCDPLTYTALQEHAPDFYDYYISLFTFLDAAPVPGFAESKLYVVGEVIPANTYSPQYQTLAFYEEQVKQKRKRTIERARALLGLADALSLLPDSPVMEHLLRAKAAIDEALPLLSREKTPYDWARAKGILGNILSHLPTNNRSENLREAIACYEASLQVCTERNYPYEWAKTQNNLGNAYTNLPIGDRAENLKEAIACYEAALRVRTEQEFPFQWAMTQNNLATAYAGLPTGDRVENLKKAIACDEAALRVYTEQDYPHEWARTQNNLGTAYKNLRPQDRAENLKKAIACYEAGLRVFTEQNFPYEWAGAQNNLGNAYISLTIGDRAQNLKKAIACYEEAFRVYSEADFPQECANAHYNCGVAFSELKKEEGNGSLLLKAQEHFAAAAQGYASIGLAAEAAESEEIAARIEVELEAKETVDRQS